MARKVSRSCRSKGRAAAVRKARRPGRNNNQLAEHRAGHALFLNVVALLLGFMPF
jgi:hypothetical protein